MPEAALPATESADPVDGVSARAREAFVFLLQLAYSGELGAARAYAGHAAVLTDPAQRRGVRRILFDEVRHRRFLRRTLAELGSAPVERRERKLDLVGRSIAAFCQVGGWFFPMYGAGKLEAQNIREYEHAARLAHVGGLDRYVEELLVLAEVEWDHEKFFRDHAAGHFLWRVTPHWPLPPPRSAIRETFAAFVRAGSREVEPVRAPWLIR